MCGVDPHELPPLIVSQVIDEGVVGEIACKGIAATDGGQAFLDQNVTILFGAECGTQAGQRWHTWHDPFAKHTMREPDPEGASEQPRNKRLISETTSSAVRKSRERRFKFHSQQVVRFTMKCKNQGSKDSVGFPRSSVRRRCVTLPESGGVASAISVHGIMTRSNGDQ